MDNLVLFQLIISFNADRLLFIGLGGMVHALEPLRQIKLVCRASLPSGWKLAYLPVEPLLPELPEPEALLPEEPLLVAVSGVAELDEPGPDNGFIPEASLPEVPGLPLEPELPLEVPLEPELPPEVLPAESVPMVGEVEPEEPELPLDVLPAESVPIVGELDPEEPVPIEPVELPELPEPELPDDPDESVLPLPIPEEPEEPEAPDEPLLNGSFTVVVVVVVVVPALPDEPLDALLGDSIADAPFWASLDVVVVVCCAKPAPAVPIKVRKIAKGNFFMIIPFN